MEDGKKYRVVTSQKTGAHRYNIGDIVEVINVWGNGWAMMRREDGLLQFLEPQDMEEI